MTSPDDRLIGERLREGTTLRTKFAQANVERINTAAHALVDCLRMGHKVLIFGNGGSAADAQHFAAELVGRFGRDRAPMPAIALTTDTSALTAIGNDYGFDHVFARQVQALALPGDVVVAISTSGRSPNVLSAVSIARANGAQIIALTGGDGGELLPAADVPIVVPSNIPARIQEVHISVIHILCELIESSLLSSDGPLAVPTRPTRWDELVALRSRWKAEGKTVVWTNGCFDILHVGHIHLLEQAKRFGDLLIVGVNDDASVKAIKGPERPIFSVEDRIRLLAALRTTDYVTAFEGATPEAALASLQPDVHVKGADYASPSGKPMPERAVVENYGGRIEFVPLVPERSTSKALRRMKRERHD